MNGNHFNIHDLKREYEKGRKQGAVEELEKIIKILSYPDMDEIYETKMIMKHCKRRLLELRCEQK